MNNEKREKPPSRLILDRRKDVIISYWEILNGAVPRRFALESRKLAGSSLDFGGGLPANWELNTIQSGPGLLESAHEGAHCVELRYLGPCVAQEQVFPLEYRGQYLAAYIADLVVEGTIIVEFKSVRFSMRVIDEQLTFYSTRVGWKRFVNNLVGGRNALRVPDETEAGGDYQGCKNLLGCSRAPLHTRNETADYLVTVEPVDPFECCMLRGVYRPPRSTGSDDFGLE